MPKKVPEGLVALLPDTCDFCGVCVAVCPVDCIELAEYRLTIDLSVCTRCMNCVIACPVNALVFQTDRNLHPVEDLA